MKINLLSRLIKGKDKTSSEYYKKCYTRNKFRVMPLGEKKFPNFKLYHSREKVYAYTAQFIVTPFFFDKTNDIIFLFFNQHIYTGINKYGTFYLNYQGREAHFITYKEYGYDAMIITTNDIEFIHKLQNAGLEPPSPREIFIDIDFDSPDFGKPGFLKDDFLYDIWLEKYWIYHWQHFWNSLNEEAKEQYIKRNNLLSDGVKKYLSDGWEMGTGILP